MGSKNGSRTHQFLVKRILARYGSSIFVKLWQNNTGSILVDGRIVSFGLKGSADILGIACDGKLIAIEVKTGSAKLTQEQKLFRRMVETMGGYYYEARTDDCLDELINKLSTIRQQITNNLSTPAKIKAPCVS